MNKKLPTSVHYVTVDPDFTNQRIDNFLITRLKGVPKTHIYRILRKGEVRVNKKRAQPSYRVQAGDQIRIPPIRLAEETKPAVPSRSLMTVLSERIVYEDKNLLIINKPAGIAVHGGSGVKIGVVEALRCMYPKLPHLELGHRLDLDTSGCLVLAKKRSILKEVHDLFRAGQVHKIYHALTKGHWRSDELKVDVPLRKNQLSSGERIVKVDREGKPSITLFRQLKSFKNASLVEATLLTGRTHQIRVHCQHRNHPIAGDEKYGDREFNKTIRQLGLKRLFLHSQAIEFTLGSTGETIKVSAELDADLRDCLDALKSN
jgi:23S rRNA pseudouridine955/2504/2580 synthase